MAYIGRDIQYGVLDKQSFTANSSTTAFSLNSGVKNAKSLLVSIGGIIQEPDVAYTASGTALTFTTAPATGMTVYAIYLGKTLESGGARDQITFQNETGDGTTTPFTLSATPVNAQSIMVTLNGVTQVPGTDYTVAGTTITFTTAPVVGMGILVYHLGSAAAIGEVADASITDAKIVGMNASKLTGTLGANTVPNTSIVTMDAAKLTGTLPSSMEIDTTDIDHTIASLGMHVAVADNKASFNLPGVFIDQFESDTGILTETTVDRNTTGEFVSSMSSSAGADAGGTSGSWTNSNTSHNIATAPTYGTGDDLGMNGTSYNYNYISHSSGTETTTGEAMLVGDCRSSFTGVSATIADTTTGGASEYYEFGLMTSITNAEYNGLTGINSDGIYIAFGGNGKTIHIVKKTGLAETLLSSYTQSWTSSQEISLARSGSTMYLQIDGVTVYTVGSSDFNSSAALKVVYAFGRGATARAFNDCAFRYNATALKGIESGTDSATGTLISTASTADSATTTASGVMVYENSSGTATLGTDLKAYFSADDGANWTEASSYGSTINFNGASKKLVKLGKTTGLTSGTQMKLKAEWANQATGTKVTRLHGWAINY